jgi:hypothetical protein
LAIWMSSFHALILLIQNLFRLVAFSRNLMFSVKMFHRFSKKMIRLLMNMRRFKGSQSGSVFKALIFPKLTVPLFLLRLILSWEKLIVFGTWGVVSAVLNLITLGVIVPPPRCAACFKKGHKFKFCQTISRTRVFWRPKV